MLSYFTELLRRPPVTWWDILDIAIVSIVIYELLKLIRGTRAVQLAAGITSIVVLFYFSRYFQLETLNWLIRNFVGYVVFAAIVLLQADIRRALVHLGRARIFRRLDRKVSDDDTVEELVVATGNLASKKIGAIIVIERSIGLRNYIESGILLEARLTYDLLVSIFQRTLAAARRRGHHPGRSRRRRRVLPAAHHQPAHQSRAGVAPSRGDRRHRRKRLDRDRRVRRNRANLAGGRRQRRARPGSGAAARAAQGAAEGSPFGYGPA